MRIDLSVLRSLEREREIPFEEIAILVEHAVLRAYERHMKSEFGKKPTDGARAYLDRTTGSIKILAPKFDAEGNKVGEEEERPEDFVRVAMWAAKQVINQRIRNINTKKIVGEFKPKEGQILSGTIVQNPASSSVFVSIGGTEAIMSKDEQVTGEDYSHGKRLRVYVVKVESLLDAAKVARPPRVYVSRTHPNLVRRLFELEVPEIGAGFVGIESIAREPGFRTKIAVRALEEGFNPKGACIGELGSRVRAVTAELGGEKIDIVEYSDDLAQYVFNALSPARPESAFVLSAESRAVRVIVPDDQLSLAIGRDGQNARLAARLTGAKIDVQPESIMNA